MKEKLKSIFYPNKIFGFIIFNVTLVLFIYVFSNSIENTVLAYITYFLSTYCLIIFVIWISKVIKNKTESFKKNSKIYKVYNENNIFINEKLLSFTFLINLIYGVFKLITGIYYNSAWFITFAVYYLLLCFMRGSLIHSIKKEHKDNLIKKYKKLKLIGIILLFLDLILSGIIILIIHQNQTFIYQGNLIYIVAMYDFYLIITAFINVFKYRKDKNPIMIASKCINLTVAMISIISLEVAMIYQFGNNEDYFKLIMVSVTGFFVAFINSVMSIYMIVKANKNLKKE